MKRCWFGGGLLAGLLILGLLTSLSLGKFHQDLSDRLSRAAEITGQDREQAQKIATEARMQWESRRFLAAVLNDHAPMEEIEEHFALLTPGAETEDFRETCLRLSAQLQALGESQQLTLENLF